MQRSVSSSLMAHPTDCLVGKSPGCLKVKKCFIRHRKYIKTKVYRKRFKDTTCFVKTVRSRINRSALKCSLVLPRNELNALNGNSRIVLNPILWLRNNCAKFSATSSVYTNMLLVLLLLLASPGDAFCPHGCSCNDVSVDCNRVGLETVPILLNPRTVSISLAGNEIPTLQQDLIFYTDLITLDLSSNRISLLGEKNFEGQVVLNTLTLNNNSISSLQEDNFYGLGNLQMLSLKDNSLSRIDDRVFKGLHSLESLSLENNRIKDIDNLGFEYLRSIKSINLVRNRLGRIPTAAIAHLISLDELNFSDNHISRVPENAFQKLIHLQHLDLSRNNISLIESESFVGLGNLRSLNLLDNRLSVIPVTSFPPLKSLITLDLSGNLFSSIPRDFLGHLSSLVSLKLERSPRLISINQDAFVSGWRLQDLSLKQNPYLKTLPPTALAPLLALRTLDLSACGLVSLQPTQIPLNELSRLDVSGNPFHCNCSLMWLAKVAANGTLAPGIPTCAAPPALYGVALKDLGSGTCGSAVGPWTIVGCVGVAVAGLLTIMAFLAFRWKRNNRGNTAAPQCPAAAKTIQLCIDSSTDHQMQRDFNSPLNNDLSHMQVYSQPSYYTGSGSPVQFIYPSPRQPLHSCPSDCPCIRQSPALRPLLITPNSTPTQTRMPVKIPLGSQQPSFVEFPPPPPSRPPPSVSSSVSSSHVGPPHSPTNQQHHYQYAPYIPSSSPPHSQGGLGSSNFCHHVVRPSHHHLHYHQPQQVVTNHPGSTIVHGELLSPADWLYATAASSGTPASGGCIADDAAHHWYASIDGSSSSAGAGGGNESSGYWEEDKEMPTASLLPIGHKLLQNSTAVAVDKSDKAVDDKCRVCVDNNVPTSYI